MKKMKTTMVMFGILLVLSSGLVSANVDHQNEIEEGKKLVESEIDCDELSDEQLESIGNYYMEQMHPGEDHEMMDQMMGGEGSESLKQMHINMARMMYCGEGGMMGMMPMMMNMMGGNMMSSGMMSGQTLTQTNMMQGMVGDWGYESWYWNFLNILYVTLLIGLII